MQKFHTFTHIFAKKELLAKINPQSTDTLHPSSISGALLEGRLRNDSSKNFDKPSVNMPAQATDTMLRLGGEQGEKASSSAIAAESAGAAQGILPADAADFSNNKASSAALQEFEYKESWEELMEKRNYCINLLEKTEFNRKEIEVLQELRDKRSDMELGAEKIEVMRQGLELMKQEVQKKIDELAQMRNEIKLHSSGGDAPNFAKLIRIYENMKPEDCARIFNLLENDVLIDMAENMKENKFAAILARMDLKKVEEFNKALNYRRIILSD